MTETAQAELHYEVAGEGPPVVLIHEGIADSRMWEPQWTSFPPTHRTVRYDMRGFGETPITPGSFSNARDLVGLLERLALGPAALVGVSLGGRVALEVAVARPELVSALVLVGAGLPGHDWTEETQAGWAEEQAALERGDVEAAVELNLRMWVDGPGRSPSDVDAGVREQVAVMQRRAFELQLPVGDAAEEEPLVPDLAERLTEIRAPTLIVVGEEDRPDIHTIADRLAAALPHARRASIPATAHIPSLERPDEFDRLVLEFLS
ncbi:MAG TPA: alpha/beta fold hydrolase [Gaiellaceae bacterium]|nr:alpha/beta fold hydrolase [Gaiellaceae bacterium]